MNPVWVIAKRELNSYFDSLIAYVFLVIFLGFTGFFTWFYPSDIFFRGQVDMQVFFFFASWTLFFFIPAITMRQVAEERDTGTIELLLTKAVTDQQVIVGKFVACFLLVCVALACTLPYYFSISSLGDIDHGSTVSGYLALLLLSAVYIAIGIWASSVTKKQLIALILSLGVAINFQLLFGLGASGSGFFATLLDSLSLTSHYESISRGVWDTKDILYFLSMSAFFIAFAIEVLSLVGRGKGFESDLKSPLPNALGIGLGAIFAYITYSSGVESNGLLAISGIAGLFFGEIIGHLIMNKRYTLILMFGIVILINLISQNHSIRWDMTDEEQYTLSNATENILESLEDPVTVTAYFTEDLPPQLQKLKDDFRDKLIEYSSASGGYLDFKFTDPSQDDILKQTAMMDGVMPVPVQMREKDQVKQQEVFIGAVLEMGEQKEVIPMIASGTGMEYALSTAIKKMSVVDKPSVGLIQGHGEPGLQELEGVYAQLSILYNVENIDLNAETSIPDRFRAVALIAPTDSIPPDHFAKMDDYLGRGGKMMIGINAVNGDFQTAQGTALTTGLETWLSEKGLIVDPTFVIDANCGTVTVQRQQGMFRFQTPVQFPFLPLVSNFPEHPITKGLEQVVMPFASNIRFSGDSSKTFTPIAYTSERAGSINVPTQFDVNKQWTEADFPIGNLVLGGILEGKIVGDMPSKMVVFGDGDFPTQGRGQNSDNANLMSNTIDWLSDDTGLIELRTKGVVTRPISDEYLGDENEGKRNTMKFMNFGMPIFLILLFGFYRFQRQIRLRKQRESVSYA